MHVENSANGVNSENTPDNLGASSNEDVVESSLVWFGVLGGAVAWMLHLLLSYLVAEFGCVSGWNEVAFLGISRVGWAEIAVSIFALSIAIVATLIAHRATLRLNGAKLSRPVPVVQKFLANFGMLSSGIFILIIAIQSLPLFYYLQEC